VSEIMRTLGCRVATPADHVDHASREDLGQQLAELQRGERRLLGRLEHAGVARGQCRAELPCRHHQRVIPRCDGGHDADRVAADHAREAGEVFSRHGTGHRPARAGEESEHVGNGRDLVAERGRVGFAAVERLEPGVCRAVGLDAIGQLEQQRSAVLRRGARPCIECGIRRLHRGVDLAARRLGHFREHLAGRGVEHLFDLALACDELAVDQEPGSHVGTPKVNAGS
jgi:hypothetical protein